MLERAVEAARPPLLTRSAYSSGPTSSTTTKASDATAIRIAPAVRKSRRPKRSTAVPISGIEITTVTP